jgi:YebC/PmpR family DNA-binding regulatory protein
MGPGTPRENSRASGCKVTVGSAMAGRLRGNAKIICSPERSKTLTRHTENQSMAGHSKWANIRHKKAAADAKKGKIFTRLIKEITVAARMGGADPAMNPRLRLAMDKAYDANMPKDNIERAIKRGSGELEGVAYEEIRYEGYGVAGSAVMVDCLTDNRTRTVADVRHAFTKHGGNLGTDGSVSFLFKNVGQFVFAPGTSEDKVMEAALDAGAEDVLTNDDGSIEVICAPEDFVAVRDALTKAGLKPELGEITMKPTTENALKGDEASRMQKLLDALENIDDVQNVYTTAVLDQ